jgi:hypothetical protein
MQSFREDFKIILGKKKGQTSKSLSLISIE